MQLTRKDGTSFYASVHSVPVRDAEGNLTGVRSAIGDITERKQADQALRDSEARYQRLVELSPDAILVHAEGKYVYANPAGIRLFGAHSSEEVIGRDVLESIHPDHRQSMAHRIEEACGGTVTPLEEIRFMRLDGSTVDTEVTCRQVEFGGRPAIQIVVRDITARKQAEEARRQSEEFLRTTFEYASVGMAIGVPDGTFVRTNAAFDNMLGYEPGELTGVHRSAITPPDDVAHNEERYRRFLASGMPSFAFEKRYVRKDGRVIWVNMNVSFMRDADGEAKFSIIMAQDITERKRAEEALQKAHDELELRVEERTAELQQAYDQLKKETREREQVEAQLRQAQKMEAIGTLAGGIAHDFNNILAGIIGFSELAADEIPDDSKAQRHLKKVLKAGLRAKELVKQILAFSRKSEGERKPISLTPLVRETHALLRASLPTTTQMPLAINTSDDYVLADPIQIQQVLMNLATNAAHAMREGGGQLTIGVSSVTFPPGSLVPDPDMEPGTYVKLTVEDTGTGMTEEVRQRIFEPFFTTKEREKGTGMGLAVVYGVVKSHRGTVTVQSEVGRGSTFAVFLPRAQKPKAKKDETTTSTLQTGTERILFVDDEEMLAEMARDMLKSLGYHVTVAKHPTEAWNLFLEDPSQFDLVITDQTMPGTTGVTLAQKMLRVRKEMPIILCTGYSEMVSADQAKEVGISEFVMKPVVKKELAETIRKVLDVKTVGV